MLARLVGSSLRAPASRATPASLRIASSTQWTRGLAGNKPGQPPNPPTGFAQGRKATGAALPFGTSKSKGDEKAGGATSRQTGPEVSAQQPEESAPQNESSSANEPAQPFKLPDLRGGLPSTLEFETTGSTASESAASALNLTEDPNKPAGSGGRGPKGELPASAYVSSSEKKRARVANYMYGAFFASCVAGYVYLGRNWESEEEERQHADAPSGWSFGAMWARFRARTGDQLNYYSEPAFKKLLPDVDPSFERPYTLVLSLEDLLIHSEWSREHGWRRAKRPGVDYFLRYLSQYYELVIFTTVPWAVGEPVIRKLDPYHIVTWPLYREATMYRNGDYVKVCK
jgi:import inner membrane translocase subunit TIM50